MIRIIVVMTLLALLMLAHAANAVTSRDECVPECDGHQLQWRPVPVDAWANVGAVLPVADVTHESVVGSFRGVQWTGTSSFGEFRASATRGTDESGFSTPINLGEPPVAPTLFAALGTIGLIRWRRTRR